MLKAMPRRLKIDALLMINGYLTLLLTGHVSYVRTSAREPAGEDLLHETIADAIVPTLNALYDLRDIGRRPAIALAYSPVLLEQLADSVVQKHFFVWMERRLAHLAENVARWDGEGEAHRSYLGRFYQEWCRGILESFIKRYNRNVVAAMRELCAEGMAEPLSSAATHAYLPLLRRVESQRAQIDVGALAMTRQLGARPRGRLPDHGARSRLCQRSDLSLAKARSRVRAGALEPERLAIFEQLVRSLRCIPPRPRARGAFQ